MSNGFGFSGTRVVPPPVNEPVKAYGPASPEKIELKARLKSMAAERMEIPVIIGGKEVQTGDLARAVMPHNHGHVLADWHKASPRHVQQAIEADMLRGAAGNFYINDKPTGAMVGQQPFGGARASGTNDKAGSKLNLVRWVSARAIKETFNPPRDYRYPFMAEE